MSLRKKYRACHAIGISVAFLLFTFACRVSPNDPDPEDLYGRWKLTETKAVLDEASAPLLEKQKDYQTEDLYFEFLPRGIFGTNTDLGLNKLLLKEADLIAGSYVYEETSNGTFIELTFDDPQYNQEITLRFEASDLHGSAPSLVMDTQNYIYSIRTSSDRFSTEIRNALYQFTTRINQARFSLNFSKTN